MSWKEKMQDWFAKGQSLRSEAGKSAKSPVLAFAALAGAIDLQKQIEAFEKREWVMSDKIHRLEVRIRELESRHV
jgi:phage shock protein A